MINGIMVEGNWITNPCLIKDAFLQFYKRKFQAQDSQLVLIPSELTILIICNPKSPTLSFPLKRGLGKENPLSPYSFHLGLEGLHNAFEEAVGNGLITGVNIKNSTINVSHLFYAEYVNQYY
ncbi:hypothetical protein Tco_0174182 [Tanacetum coccineum]